MTNSAELAPQHQELPADVIDLSSPEREDSSLAPTTMENNDIAQPCRQRQSSDAGALLEATPPSGHAGLKRLWGEMSAGPGAEGLLLLQDKVAAPMHWGGTGPRMPRTRTTNLRQQQQCQQHPLQLPSPHQQQQQQQQAAAAQVPPQPAANRRKLTVRPRSSRPLHQQQQHQQQQHSVPIVVIDDESPLTARAAARLSTLQQQQQQRSSYVAAAAAAGANIRTGPTSIRINPSITLHRASASPTAAGSGGGSSSSNGRAPLLLRRSIPPAAALAAAAGRQHAAAAAAGGSTGSEASLDPPGRCSSQPGGSSDTAGDAEFARRSQQEEQDAALARRLMQEEQQLLARQQAAERHRLVREQEAAEEAAAAAAAAAMAASSGGGSRSRRGTRHPQQLPPDLLQQQQQQQHHGQPWGAAASMAQALLALPRWGVPGGAAPRGRGLPRALTAMREAVLGMQRAGLPPQLLFSDRDFTADDYELLCRLDETVENRRGAGAATIASLPTQTVPAGGLAGAAGERLSCAVCLEEFAEGAELRSLPCLHRFHKECIDKWLGVKAACPVCNRECS